MEANIVEAENFVQHSEERRSNTFAREAKQYLECYPDTQYVDVLLTDLNGCFHGKRPPIAGLHKLEKSCYFPASVFVMDILDNVVEEAGLGQKLGKPDQTCVPVAGTLTPSVADPESIAQMVLTILGKDGTPFDVEPRDVLDRLWQKLRQRGLFLVAAVELEFYLLNRKRDPEGYLQPPCAPRTDNRNTQGQIYSVDSLNHFADVLNDIDELAHLQLIPAGGAVAEASPGQFKINLYHTNNVLDACDDALALKHPIWLVAEKHKMHVTFIAKPYEGHAGSGMHIHISVMNNKGENVLADANGDGSALLKRALAGVTDPMPASMALLAPSMSSYRRFQLGIYVPTQASWGYNNRIVALRIPCGDCDNHRIEYYVAGADTNPYLVMSTILAGILHGLDSELPLQEEVKGNGLEQEGLPSPIRQSDTLWESMQNDSLRELLGGRFSHVYHACKDDELIQFERLIIDTEIEWILKNAWPLYGSLKKKSHHAG